MAVGFKQKGNKITCILVDHRNGRQKKYYGEAICSPEDTFNLEKGKEIAFNRARLMELGENDVQDQKLLENLEKAYRRIKDRFEKRKKNRENAKAIARAALVKAYES